MTMLRVLLARIRGLVTPRSPRRRRRSTTMSRRTWSCSRSTTSTAGFTAVDAQAAATTRVRRHRSDEGDLSGSAWPSRHRSLAARPQICSTDPPPRSGVCDGGHSSRWRLGSARRRPRSRVVQRRDAAPAARARPRSARPAPATASRRALHPRSIRFTKSSARIRQRCRACSRPTTRLT